MCRSAASETEAAIWPQSPREPSFCAVLLGAASRGDGGGPLQGAAILEVGRDPGDQRGVIADLGSDPSRLSLLLHHGVGICAW